MTEKTNASLAGKTSPAARSKPATAAPFGPGRIAMTAVTVIAILGVAWLAITLTRFFMLVFAAIVLGAIFDAIASWLVRRTTMKRGFALAGSVVGIIAIFAGAFVLFGSQLASEVDTIREQVPRALQGVEAFLDRFGLGTRVRELAEVGGNDISQLADAAAGAGRSPPPGGTSGPSGPCEAGRHATDTRHVSTSARMTEATVSDPISASARHGQASGVTRTSTLLPATYDTPVTPLGATATLTGGGMPVPLNNDPSGPTGVRSA